MVEKSIINLLLEMSLMSQVWLTAYINIVDSKKFLQLLYINMVDSKKCGLLAMILILAPKF
jgi:hypothetical protein